MAYTKIKNILSSRFSSYSVVVMAFGIRAIQIVFYYDMGFDGMYQVIAMQNFVRGHGFSLSNVLPSDIAVNHYSLLFNWPPGYSFLLAPFYLLFKHNYIAASITFELLFAFLQIILSRSILWLLGTEKYAINAFTLFSAFFLYSFYKVDSSDSIAITFFLIALYYSLKLFKTQKDQLVSYCIIILSLFMCGMIRYMFFVVAFGIPLYMFIKEWRERRKLSWPGTYISASIAVLFLAFLVYEKLEAGRMGWIHSPVRGFFPDNLKAAWPAIPASFINPDIIKNIFPRYDPAFFAAMQIVNVLILIALAYTCYKIIRFNKERALTLSSDFLLIYFLTSILLTGLLCVLSLSIGPEDTLGWSSWTYVQEARYYGTITILTQLLVFNCISSVSFKHSGYTLLIKAFFLLLISVVITRGTIFITNRIKNIHTETYNWRYELSVQQFADNIIQNEQKDHPGINVVVTGSNFFYYRRSAIYSHVKTLLDPFSINSISQVKASKPSVIIAIIEKDKMNHFAPFIRANTSLFAGHFRDFYFYKTYVQPD